MWILCYFVMGLAIAVEGGKHDIYTGNSVHSVRVSSREEARQLDELVSRFRLDVWQDGSQGRNAEVMIGWAGETVVLDELDALAMEHELLIKDVVSYLTERDDEWTRWHQTKSSRAFPFENYPRYDAVIEYLESLAARYPSLVSVQSAGRSYEGRDVKYARVSSTGFQNNTKPIYFMDAMIHAREWVTTPVLLYALHRLVEEPTAEDLELLDSVDWIFLPVVNPDGYEYTHTNERLWRRTRSLNPNVTSCIGVDANRNFDMAFNTIGVSADPCSNTFPGTEAFSEPETRIVRDLLFQYLDRIQVYVNVHSHGSYMLFPYGDGSLAPGAATIHAVAAAFGAAVDAVKLPQAAFYLIGNSNLVLYGTSGSAQDYAQSIGVPWSFTLELPSLGYQFQVPPEFMPKINEETWRGLAVTARYAAAFYKQRNVTSSEF